MTVKIEKSASFYPDNNTELMGDICTKLQSLGLSDGVDYQMSVLYSYPEGHPRFDHGGGMLDFPTLVVGITQDKFDELEKTVSNVLVSFGLGGQGFPFQIEKIDLKLKNKIDEDIALLSDVFSKLGLQEIDFSLGDYTIVACENSLSDKIIRVTSLNKNAHDLLLRSTIPVLQSQLSLQFDFVSCSNIDDFYNNNIGWKKGDTPVLPFLGVTL